MPMVQLTTNVPKDADRDNKVAMALYELCHTMTQKPGQYIQTYVNAGNAMVMEGTTDPAAHVRFLIFAGYFTAENKNEFAEKVSAILHEHMGVAKARVFVEFKEPEKTLIALDGKTFA